MIHEVELKNQTKRISAGVYEYRGFTIRKWGRDWVFAPNNSQVLRKTNTILGATLKIDRILEASEAR
jgi:hypothetical protein